MIDPKYFTLNTLFASRVFRIPHYQRFYSWQKKQRDDLFEDLKGLYSKDKNSDRHHFMATIVCFRTGKKESVKTVDYGVYEIVDGQQRITTLVILLKALQKRVKDEEVQKDIGKILVKDDENLLLLQTNNINQHIFNMYLRDGLLPQQEEVKTHADTNLLNAIKETEEFLDNWEQANRSYMDLLSIVRNRIGFVIYDTEESHAVYTIFECLNSRGLAVDWLDKTKSMLMGVAFEKSKSPEAASAKINELQDSWSMIYNELARFAVSGREILCITATLFVGTGAGRPMSAEEAMEGLRSHCIDAKKTVDVTGWLQKVTSKLVQLHGQPERAPVAKILQARILAVSLMLTDTLKEEQRGKALDQWERVSFRIFGMFKKDARTKVGDYVRLAVQILQVSAEANSFKKIMNLLQVLGSEYDIDRAVDELTREPEYEGFEEECRYILWRYEEYLATRNNAEVNKEIREKIWNARTTSETIEHIFPQTPSPIGPWKEILKKNPKIKNSVHSLGNLLLLPGRLNSEAGNRGFKEKKEVYKKAESLRMVKEILSLRVWNSAKIKKRERDIIAFLKETFQDIALK